MDLITSDLIRLTRINDQFFARLGSIMGAGPTVSDALRDLAQLLELSNIEIVVPQPDRQHVEDGVLRVQCPECGYIKVMPDQEKAAYVCPGCGNAVEPG